MVSRHSHNTAFECAESADGPAANDNGYHVRAGRGARWQWSAAQRSPGAVCTEGRRRAGRHACSERVVTNVDDFSNITGERKKTEKINYSIRARSLA